MQDLEGYVFKNQQAIQGELAYGVYKGIVVDVRDPLALNRARVWIYSLHGDAVNIDVDSLPWCESIFAGRGENSPCELWDRVLVNFEVGDKYAPVITGHWFANPAGRGKLPYSAAVGSEIRPEGWHSRSLYPEARVLASDGPGNVIWTEAKYLATNNLASMVELEDTGGKQIKVRSYHTDAQPYTQLDQIASGTPLNEVSSGVCKPVRDALETVSDSTAGSIELNQINTSRVMQSSSTDFATDMLLQQGGIFDLAAGGSVRVLQQGQGSISQLGDSIVLNGTNVSTFNSYSLPRRWDS